MWIAPSHLVSGTSSWKPWEIRVPRAGSSLVVPECGLTRAPTSHAGEPTAHKVKRVPPDIGVSFYLLEHLAWVLTYWNSTRSWKRSRDFSKAAPWWQHLSDTDLQESGCKSSRCHRLRKCPTTHVPPFSSLRIRIIIVPGSEVFMRVKLHNAREVLRPAPNKRPPNPTSQTGKLNLSDLLKNIQLLSHKTRTKIQVS